MHRNPRAIVQSKKQRRRGRNLDLLVVTRAFQFPSASKQIVIELTRSLDCSRVKRLGNAVKLGVGGIEQDYSPLGEQFREQTREGAAECLARTIRLAKEFHHFGFAEQSSGGLDRRLDFSPKDDSSHR